MGPNKFIESSVFFFLHNEIDVMNNDDMLCIASSLYYDGEVMGAKQNLYRVMYCQIDFVERRGGCASKENITHKPSKLTTAPPSQVKIWITNSRRVPPVFLDHVDVAALLKSVMEVSIELINCQENLKQQESLYHDKHDKLEDQQSEIDALKMSS